ncbi:MAG: hypothetical protein ACI4WT_12615 [Oligosphaeraceae bacterium]
MGDRRRRPLNLLAAAVFLVLCAFGLRHYLQERQRQVVSEEKEEQLQLFIRTYNQAQHRLRLGLQRLQELETALQHAQDDQRPALIGEQLELLGQTLQPLLERHLALLRGLPPNLASHLSLPPAQLEQTLLAQLDDIRAILELKQRQLRQGTTMPPATTRL